MAERPTYAARGDAFRFRGYVAGLGLYVGAHVLNADTGDMYTVTGEVGPFLYHIAHDA